MNSGGIFLRRPNQSKLIPGDRSPKLSASGPAGIQISLRRPNQLQWDSTTTEKMHVLQMPECKSCLRRRDDSQFGRLLRASETVISRGACPPKKPKFCQARPRANFLKKSEKQNYRFGPNSAQKAFGAPLRNRVRRICSKSPLWHQNRRTHVFGAFSRPQGAPVAAHNPQKR